MKQAESLKDGWRLYWERSSWKDVAEVVGWGRRGAVGRGTSAAGSEGPAMRTPWGQSCAWSYSVFAEEQGAGEGSWGGGRPPEKHSLGAWGGVLRLMQEAGCGAER